MMRGVFKVEATKSLWAVVCCLLLGAANPAFLRGAEPPREDPDGTIHIPAFSLAESSFLTPEARLVLQAARTPDKQDADRWKVCPSIETASSAEAPAIHKCRRDAFTASSFYVRLRDRYAVVVHPEKMGGVHTEVFAPARGMDFKNSNRVLINVHGGGFLDGWGINSVLEAVPVASVARIKVISIDYREGPEHQFPAASEDLAVVYRELLKTYKPKNIGIYGCSSGGLMTAEALAWFQKEGLPPPGAAAMLCAAATYWSDGDSGYFGRAMFGTNFSVESSDKNPYFKNTKPDDPLAFPAFLPSITARFPPSLLITGTRDFALSSVVFTHSQLVAQGVEADLHVWEGLGHALCYDTDLPESREVYETVAKFFEKHLGRN